MADTFVQITGFQKLDENLQHMKDAPAKKIGGRVVARMAAVAARYIRRFIAASIAPKTADKGIGSRRVRTNSGGAVLAKAGIAVGRAFKNALNVVNRGKRKGVGVTAKNLHWFARGTKQRYTGQKTKGRGPKARQVSTGNPRKYTGMIDKAKWGGFVQAGVAAGESEMLREAQLLGDRLIREEAEKLQPATVVRDARPASASALSAIFID